jgi:molybdopterin-guanine dinucleotide biosynthesis protein A
MNISAVLLAGGESRRMGEDKATLLFRGEPLWHIQLDLLRKLEPAEILISARIDPVWRPNEYEFVPDDTPSRGPLSGLAAALGKIRTKHVLGLAIDMPFMNERYLRSLYECIKPSCGVLPKIGNRAEPLAAIFPAEARMDFALALTGANFSLQQLTERLTNAGRLHVVPVEDRDVELFRNLNERDDLTCA